MKARIYQRSKTAMQSGRAKEGEWVMEYEFQSARRPDALMGWTAAHDTANQPPIIFKTLEDAKRFAREQGILYTVLSAHQRRIRPRNYGDNFKYVSERDD